MRRLLALLGRRRKPPVPVSVEISWQCSPGNLDEQFVRHLKQCIRRNGGSAGVFR